jgi:hypothetical protein
MKQSDLLIRQHTTNKRSLTTTTMIRSSAHRLAKTNIPFPSALAVVKPASVVLLGKISARSLSTKPQRTKKVAQPVETDAKPSFAEQALPTSSLPTCPMACSL